MGFAIRQDEHFCAECMLSILENITITPDYVPDFDGDTRCIY
ncbi:4282_t:CDS:2 [Cetraspora pellucida]|uniref:4282_t:CDS:1 n=1 Tax=Cetraspora pellucida TaxID=1433469 RepID=A0ACA9KKS7_9GLOM|nr:4282_t:CDS:2 [Cetraspora pellucida]